MSDRWFYRVFGQEFGPVSLDLVRTLVAAGTIAPDDEVRDANRSNWILACGASELRDSIKSQATCLAVERRAIRDEWFCRGVTGDFGPLTLSDLIQLAALGELKPDEEVKAKADDYWKQLRSIRRLVELLPFADHNCGTSVEPYLSIFVDENYPIEDKDPNTATELYSGNDDDPSKRDSSFERDTDRSIRHEGVTLLALERDRDDEADILLFPGVQPIKTNSEGTNSPSTPSNPVSAFTCSGGPEFSSPFDDCNSVVTGNQRNAITSTGDSVVAAMASGCNSIAGSSGDISTQAAKLSLTTFLKNLADDSTPIGISALLVGLMVLGWMAIR